MPVVHRQLQHGQDPPLRQYALSKARGADRPSDRLARLRRHPPCHHARRGGLVPPRSGLRRQRGLCDGDHHPRPYPRIEPLAANRRHPSWRAYHAGRPCGPHQRLQFYGGRRAGDGRDHPAPYAGDGHHPPTLGRVSGGDRTGCGDLRTCRQRGWLLCARGWQMAWRRYPHHKYGTPVSGHRTFA